MALRFFTAYRRSLWYLSTLSLLSNLLNEAALLSPPVHRKLRMNYRSKLADSILYHQGLIPTFHSLMYIDRLQHTCSFGYTTHYRINLNLWFFNS